MLVTMQNSELIDKLVLIAGGDIELVQQAIHAAAGSAGDADLQKVVEYVVTHRRQGVLRHAERVAESA